MSGQPSSTLKGFLQTKIGAGIMTGLGTAIIFAVLTSGAGIFVPEHTHPDTSKAQVKDLALAVTAYKKEAKQKEVVLDDKINQLSLQLQEVKTKVESNEKSRREFEKRMETKINKLTELLIDFIKSSK